MAENAEAPGRVFSLGYARRTLDRFVEVCREHGIEYLLDVRTQPYSRYRPEFCKEALSAALPGHGIRYLFMGQQLGGKLAHTGCVHSDGSPDYRSRAQQPDFRQGLDRVIKAVELGHRVALMCAEMEADGCHRSRLLGPPLLKHGIDIAHIGKDDRVCLQSRLVPPVEQMSFL